MDKNIGAKVRDRFSEKNILVFNLEFLRFWGWGRWEMEVGPPPTRFLKKWVRNLVRSEAH